MADITMRPTAGEFLINGVRVGAWHETAKGVVHAQTLTGHSRQHATFAEADEAVRSNVLEWLRSIAAQQEDKANG